MFNYFFTSILMIDMIYIYFEFLVNLFIIHVLLFGSQNIKECLLHHDQDVYWKKIAYKWQIYIVYSSICSVWCLYIWVICSGSTLFKWNQFVIVGIIFDIFPTNSSVRFARQILSKAKETLCITSHWPRAIFPAMNNGVSNIWTVCIRYFGVSCDLLVGLYF